MNLDADACYRALRTRDARFDGRFFVAVRTTRIFCRPVCPAPTAKRENCLFMASAAAAQEAGFRPCLRCRPETSPGTPAWLGSSATVSRALRLISEGALDTAGVDAVAARLGIGERQLRRLFLDHLGASPIAVAQTRRILFAKKLIDETRLPMTEIAFSSGFSSIRRFNDALRCTYGQTPTQLRRAGGTNGRGDGCEVVLKLSFRPPFDWDAIVRFLAPRATPGVEAAGSDYYRRTVRLDGASGLVEVRPVAGQNYLAARIRLSSTRVLGQAAERLRRIFDLGADPAQIAAQLRSDPRLRPRVASAPGLRVPGTWDGFELAVRAILGQQVSVRAATTFAGRLAAAYGEPLPDASPQDGVHLLFPSPESLAEADLTSVGLTRARAASVTSLATAVARGDVAVESGRSLEEATAQLARLPGVGEWTAQYIAMRAFGEPDAFPAMDLGLRKALGNGAGPVSGAQLLKAAEAWRPWRAYAAMYLWRFESLGR